MNKLDGKTILIVDDDDRNIFALQSYLEMLDAIVVTAANGEEALSKLENEPAVDVILLDMMMPVMDGFEMLAVLRSDEKLKQIPVVAVTAKAMVGDRERCIEAGAWDYVSKPLNMKVLIEIINHWLN